MTLIGAQVHMEGLKIMDILHHRLQVWGEAQIGGPQLCKFNRRYCNNTTNRLCLFMVHIRQCRCNNHHHHHHHHHSRISIRRQEEPILVCNGISLNSSSSSNLDLLVAMVFLNSNNKEVVQEDIKLLTC